MNKLAFCTVIMNRLPHLKQTLPQNIKDNSQPGVVFLVFDYGSNDGLQQWIETDMKQHIDSNKLIYKRVEAETFDRSLSRNLMFKSIEADFICNIDADNYTGKDFDLFLINEFDKSKDLLIKANTNDDGRKNSDAFGRFACSRLKFFEVTGYDMRMTSYGWEDVDLYNRLKLSGLTELIIPNKYLAAITHNNELRTCNESFLKNIRNAYKFWIDKENTCLIFNYFDKSFELAYVERNKTGVNYAEFSIVNHKMIYEHPQIHDDIKNAIKITDKEQLNRLSIEYPIALNYYFMMQNQNNNIIAPNANFYTI